MFELVRRNQVRSTILVIAMVILLAAVGFAAGELTEPGAGPGGLVLATLVGVVMFLVSFYAGSAVLLSASGAREVKKEDAPQLYNIVEEMTIASGMSKVPRVYVMESTAANAFATGRNPDVAAVAVTDGLLNILDRDELQAVIGHEMAHVKHRDILFMTLLSVMAGAIALISHFMTRRFFWFGGGRRARSSGAGGGQAQLILLAVGLALVILGGITARLIYFAASRTREYMADAGAAIFTRNPDALARALEKISGAAGGTTLPVPKVAQALLIVGPSLFATHPPVAQRIAILRGLAGGGSLSYSEYAARFQQVTGRSARFLPRTALSEAAVTVRAAQATAAPVGRVRREALDAVKKAAGFRMVGCPCGARIKIPAWFPAQQGVTCVACGAPVVS